MHGRPLAVRLAVLVLAAAVLVAVGVPVLAAVTLAGFGVALVTARPLPRGSRTWVLLAVAVAAGFALQRVLSD